MTTISGQFSETESDLSESASEHELKIDLSYFSQKSYYSELNTENNAITKVEPLLQVDCMQSYIDLNGKSHTCPNLEISESTINSEKLDFFGLERNYILMPVSNKSISNESNENLKLDNNIAPFVNSLYNQENENFINNSELNLKINSVFSLSFTDNKNLEKGDSVSPFKISSNSQVITNNISKNRIDHSVNETEREVSIKLVELEKTLKKLKSDSILKEKFDNCLDKSALTKPKNNFNMESSSTSPLNINSENKSRPKLKSIFYAKRKRAQFECSFLKEKRLQLQTQNEISIDLKNSRPRLSETSEHIDELDSSVILESKNSRVDKHDDLQHSPSYTVLETITQSDKMGFQSTKSNIICLPQNALEKEDSILKLERLDHISTESGSDEKELFNEKATKVSTKQFILSPDENFPKESLNSESDSDNGEEFQDDNYNDDEGRTNECSEDDDQNVDEDTTKELAPRLISSSVEDIVKNLFSQESDSDSKEEFDKDDDHNDDETTKMEYNKDDVQNNVENATEVLAPQLFSSDTKDIVKDVFSSESNSDDGAKDEKTYKDATEISASHLPPSQNKDLVKLLSSDSDDDEEDPASMKENILKFFTNHNREEIAEMFNADSDDDDDEEDPASMKETMLKFFTNHNREEIAEMFNAESDKVYKEFAENTTGTSKAQLLSSPSDDVLKELLSSDSDDEEDAASVKENILKFFTSHSREEITEMFNATKTGSLQMTLRDRCLKKKGRSLQKIQTTVVPKKPLSKQKSSKTSSSKDSDRNSLRSVKIKERSRKRNMPELLPCGNCNKEFSSWHRRIKHWMITKHKEPELCNWCNKSFYFVYKHIVNAHPSMCENCGKLCLHPEKKMKHSDEHEDKTIYCCDTCQYSADNEEQLREHMTTHLGNWLHICEFCEIDFVNEDCLKKHLTHFHFECHICNFQCYQEFHFNEHMLKHTEKVPFKCSICDKVCSNSKTLRYHIRGKHRKIRPYRCVTCNKSFVLKYKLADHMKVHDGNYYVCKTCGQNFIEERYLILHEVDHNIYICNFCNLEYKLKFNLITHLRGSSGDGFICQRCDLDCNCRTEYDKHMAMHNRKGEMTAVCKFCNDKQKNNQVLKAHMSRFHPEEYSKVNDKSEICKYCKHICSSKHNLLKHVRNKHPDKAKPLKVTKLRDKNSPYECNICSIKFKYICGYNKHLKSKKHNKLLQESSVRRTPTKSLYTCDICNVTYKFMYLYKKHLASKKHFNDKFMSLYNKQLD